MRILVVMNMYPPHAYGGYEALCESAVTRWRADGHAVRVLTSDICRPGVTAHAESDVRRSLPLYWRDHALVHPHLRHRMAAERRTRRIVDDEIETFRPEVVSVWNLAGLSFGILDYVARRNIPLVAVIGDRWLTFGHELDAWSRLFTRRGRLGRALGWAIRTTTGLHTVPPAHLDMTVLFASRYLDEYTEETSPFTFTRTAVVAHGVDLDAFPPAHDRIDRPWQGRLLVVSRIDPRKGLATTIRAVAKLPETSLDIAGDGDADHLSELRDLVSELDLTERVRFLGRRGRDELRDLYLSCDAALVPSEWDEPFGIVPLEALASGAPLVATGTGGSGEFLIDGETCLRYTPGDDAALADAIQRMADDPSLRRGLRQRGLDTAARLSQGNTFARLAEWHQAAISNQYV